MNNKWARLGLLGVLAGVIGLQVFAMVRSDKVYEKINEIEGGTSNVELRTLNDERRSFNTEGTKGEIKNKEEKIKNAEEGDWLVWGMGAEPETLNTVTAKDLYAYYIGWRNIFEGLMEYDPDKLVLRPKLAKSCEVTEGGKVITFVLRDDIYFSDGRPVMGEDVKFTYDTIRDPNVDAAKWAHYYADVNSIEVVDGKTVRFRLNNIYFKMLDYVSFVDIGILPKHVYQYKNAVEFNNRRSNPVGSGPYVFEKWDMGREIVLARNERYWGQKPYLKKLVYRFITNQLAALQALRAGDLDMIIAEPDQYGELIKDKDFTSKFKCLSVWNPNVGYGYIGWNEDTPFFGDRRVRGAMTLIIDREMICKYILKGVAEVPADPFYIKGPLRDPNLKPWPCDLEKAKTLLDEAGWVDSDGDGIRDKGGVKFKFKFMHVAGRGLHEQFFKHVKDQAAKVGIQVEAEPYEWSIFLTKLMDRKFEAVTLAWFTDVVEDPYEVWHSSQIGNRGSNHVGFRNKEADDIMEKARRVLDANERAVMYKRLARILHEEQPVTFLYTRPSLRLLDPRFENVVPHNIGLDWHEWWVPVKLQKYK